MFGVCVRAWCVCILSDRVFGRCECMRTSERIQNVYNVTHGEQPRNTTGRRVCGVYVRLSESV